MELTKIVEEKTEQVDSKSESNIFQENSQSRLSPTHEDTRSVYSITNSVLTPHIDGLIRGQLENSNELNRLSQRIEELTKKKKQLMLEVSQANRNTKNSNPPLNSHEEMQASIALMSSQVNSLRDDNCNLEESIRQKEEILSQIKHTKPVA